MPGREPGRGASCGRTCSGSRVRPRGGVRGRSFPDHPVHIAEALWLCLPEDPDLREMSTLVQLAWAAYSQDVDPMKAEYAVRLIMCVNVSLDGMTKVRHLPCRRRPATGNRRVVAP